MDEQPKTRRRWLQLRLSTCLLLIAVIAFGLAAWRERQRAELLRRQLEKSEQVTQQLMADLRRERAPLERITRLELTLRLQELQHEYLILQQKQQSQESQEHQEPPELPPPAEIYDRLEPDIPDRDEHPLPPSVEAERTGQPA